MYTAYYCSITCLKLRASVSLQQVCNDTWCYLIWYHGSVVTKSQKRTCLVWDVPYNNKIDFSCWAFIKLCIVISNHHNYEIPTCILLATFTLLGFRYKTKITSNALWGLTGLRQYEPVLNAGTVHHVMDNKSASQPLSELSWWHKLSAVYFLWNLWKHRPYTLLLVSLLLNNEFIFFCYTLTVPPLKYH